MHGPQRAISYIHETRNTSKGLNKGKTRLTDDGNEWIVQYVAPTDLQNAAEINTERRGRGV